jgi:protein TonB
MFARALILSLLFHLLLFALSEAGLFGLCLRPPAVPPQGPSRQVISLVEPMRRSAVVKEENPVLTASPPGAKTVRQSGQALKPAREPDPPVNAPLKKETKDEGPVPPAFKPTPSSLPPTEDNMVVPEEEADVPLLPTSLPTVTLPLPEPVLTVPPSAVDSASFPPWPEGAGIETEEEAARRNPSSGEVEIRMGGPPERVPEQEERSGPTPAPVLPGVPGTGEQSGVENQTEGISGHASASPSSAPLIGPVQVYHPAPVYPRQARRRGWEGTVCLEAVINREGQVVAVAITDSSGYELLDQAACQAVEKWRYTWPAGETALPDEYLITIKISFQLEE